MGTIYAVSNQKGGCGKTSLVLNTGAALARMGYRVCLVDCDPQANATMALGYPQPDEIPVTLPHIMSEIIGKGGRIDHSELVQKRGFMLHAQGMDFVPSSIELAGIENVLINTLSRENVLKKFVYQFRDRYDYILLDCMPSLNFVTINAMNTADQILIPMQPQFFSAKGLELLVSTIAEVRENLNPQLKIAGSLFTMFNKQLRFHNEVFEIVNNTYGGFFRIFETKIPVSVRVTETQAQGRSIYEHDPQGKVAEAYSAFAKELIESDQ